MESQSRIWTALKLAAPYLILSYPVFYLVARNLSEGLTAWDVGAPFLLIIPVASLTLGVFYAFYRSFDKAVTASAICFAVFVSYWELWLWVSSIDFLPMARNRHFLAALVPLMMIGLCGVRKLSERGARATSVAISVFALLLILMQIPTAFF